MEINKTPEERADDALTDDTVAPHLTAQRIADAIRAAVDCERERCALRLDAAAVRWPDNPQIAYVLRREAEDMRGSQ